MAALAVAGGAVSGAIDGSPGRSPGGLVRRSARRQSIRVAITDRHEAQLRPLFDEFEEEQSVSVVSLAAPLSDLYATLAVDLLQQTESIDVAILSDEWMPSLGRAEVLEVGDGLADRATIGTIDSRILRLGESAADEDVVALPWTVDVGFTALRTDLISGPIPRRWSELAGRLREIETTSFGLAGAAGLSASATFRAVMAGRGMDIVQPVTNRPTLTDYDARLAMETLLELRDFSSISPLAVDDDTLVGLIEEDTVSGCSHVWASTWLEAGAPADWTLLPALRSTSARALRLIRAWLVAVPRKSAEPELARSFVTWLLSDRTQRALLEIGLVPAVRPVLADPELRRGRPALTQIAAGLNIGVPSPPLRSFREINKLCGEAVAAILAGNATINQAFGAADAEMRRVLTREGELRL